MAEITLIPVDHDPFAAPAAKQPTFKPVDHDPFAENGPSVAADVAKSAGAGLLEGGMRMAATPLEILQGAVRLGANIGNKAREAVGWEPYTPEQMAELDQPMPGTFEFNKRVVKNVVDPFHQPQTTAGEYAKTAGEFAASSPMIEGGLLAKTLQTIGPAVVTEFAGQKAREIAPEYEPYVRAGAAVLSGGAAAIPVTRSAPKSVAASHMTHVSDDAVLAAGKLMQDAQGRGVALTWPEAIAQITGDASSLTTLQRFVESSEAGGEVMRGFMARRPSQVEQAGRSAFDEIAPPISNPSSIGPEAARAAQAVIDDTQTAINAATRPAYDAAKATVIDPASLQSLMADPLYASTLKEIRGNPALNRTIAQLPDDSVGVVDLVQRRMREAAENARAPGQASTSNLAAANFESARAPAIAAAEAATGGQGGAYAVAREAQAQLRSKYLQPLIDGPLGRIAQTSEGKAAIDALFPANPLPGSARETGVAVAALVNKSGPAAERLVRAHVESIFNEATQRLQSGANEFGGAKFAAVLTGNPEQKANLEAAIRALPNGDVRWDGFNRFLEVLEATGQRKGQGSPTNSYGQMQESLSRGGKVGEVASLASGGFLKLPERLKQGYERYRLGKGTEELARLFTDPRALPVFRALAREATNTTKAQALTARLLAIGGTQAGRSPSGQSQ